MQFRIFSGVISELINWIDRLKSLIDHLIYWSFESQVQRSPNRLCKTLDGNVSKKGLIVKKLFLEGQIVIMR